MKWLQSVLLATLLTQSGGASALCSTDGTFAPGDAIVDLFVYRPIGVVGTVLGVAGFVVALPFAGIASIPPPHDAVEKTSKLLVFTPANWTFARPFGDCKEMGYDPW